MATYSDYVPFSVAMEEQQQQQQQFGNGNPNWGATPFGYQTTPQPSNGSPLGGGSTLLESIPGEESKGPMNAAEVYPGLVQKSPSDPFWSNDITVLLRADRLVEFFPLPSFSPAEKLNAIARFGIYAGILMSLYKKSAKYLYISAGILLLTQFMYVNTAGNSSSGLTENFTAETEGSGGQFLSEEENATGKGPYTYPTPENPFMNVTLADYINDPGRPPAVPYGENTPASQRINKQIEKLYFDGVFRNSTDIFGRDGGDRQFYTMPSTTIPNDRDAFMKWCYGGDQSCKEDTMNCFKFKDVRQQPAYLPPIIPSR